MFKLVLLVLVLVVIALGFSFLFFGFLFEAIGDVVINIIEKTKRNIFGEDKHNG